MRQILEVFSSLDKPASCMPLPGICKFDIILCGSSSAIDTWIGVLEILGAGAGADSEGGDTLLTIGSKAGREAAITGRLIGDGAIFPGLLTSKTLESIILPLSAFAICGLTL
jgi:hypothetical protein